MVVLREPAIRYLDPGRLQRGQPSPACAAGTMSSMPSWRIRKGALDESTR